MAGFNNESKSILRAVKFIDEHLYVLLNAIGPIGVAVFLTFVPDWWKSYSPQFPTSASMVISFFFNPISGSIIFLALAVIGATGQARDIKKMQEENKDCKEKLKLATDKNATLETKLKDEIESNYTLHEELTNSFKEIAHLWTSQIFRELNFNHNHRISVYYLDARKENLVLLDRFTNNEELSRDGRSHFPKTEGVTGKALKHGICIEDGIPCSVKNEDAYCTYLKSNYNIPSTISRKFRMKSRSLRGFAIKDTNGHFIGVVIFESLEQGSLEINQLQTITARENGRLLDFISRASLRDDRSIHSPADEKGEIHEQKAA